MMAMKIMTMMILMMQACHNLNLDKTRIQQWR
jgi:hypothetical protein